MANLFRKAARLSRGGVVPSEAKSVRPGQLLGSHAIGEPMWQKWSTEKAVRDGYASSHWVFAAVRRISQAAASIEWVASVDGEDAPEHPLTKLMARPNPYTSGQDMIERIAAHLYLGGNAIVTKIGSGAKSRRAGDVAELWTVMPDRVQVIPSRRNHVQGYRLVGADGKELPDLVPKDVVHMMFTNPGDDYWGMSPLQAVARSVDTDVEAVKWNKVALQNRAVADGALSTDQQLNNEQFDRLNEQIKADHSGPSNARKTLLLEAGLSWQQMSLSPAEMDFIESRKVTREEILAAFGVPPAMVGIVQSATQSDVEAMRLQFWLDTIVPFVRDLQSAFDLSLASEYGSNVTLRPMLEAVDALQADRGELIDQAQKLFSMGVPVERIDALLELGIEPYEGWERSVLPQNMQAPAADAVNGSLASAMLGLNTTNGNGGMQ